ncbi:MAG TPA: GNAT family N-acetyltransferase [Terracidiphilus sp.]|jgi:ribosomal protein S18 acetylase RimI-like enzyme
MIVIKRITAEDGLVFKDVRLRALQDSPTSFSGTYAKEVQSPNEEWRERADRCNGDLRVGFLAYDDDRACGMVFCFRDELDETEGSILSMWVDPAVRRAGVGKLLIDSVVDWAKSRGIRGLKLMVTSVNGGAIGFYERNGFRMSGATGPYPNDPAIIEYEMVRKLA